MYRTPLFLVSTAALLATGALRAQFAEGFDSLATADITIDFEADTATTFVDYSNMTVGAASFTLPEAPRRIPGSASTRGVLLRANLTTGTTAAINILAGTTPYTFAGRYRLSFDAWINVPDPMPTSGSTEQLLWGISSDGTAPLEARHNLATGAQGVFGWLAGENGYSSEDAVICEHGIRLAQYGDTQSAAAAALFNEAFDKPVVTGAPNNAPANQWVRVDVDVDTTDVRVYFNGVEFFNVVPITPPTGYAMIGYEDPFTSLGSTPDDLWCVLDNFRVGTPVGCGGPGTATIQGTATGGEILNGAALPAVGCPMTIRLRGAGANAATLLALGYASPITLPFPLPGGSCTVGVEVNPIVTTLFSFADGLGNGNFTIDLPLASSLCGRDFGFQYFHVDSSACGIAHTEGLKLTIGS